MQQDKGVDTAIQSIYRDLDYAKSLIKAKTLKNASNQPKSPSSEGNTGSDDEPEEESWTFVGGDEIDPELVVKKSALSQMERSIGALGGSSSSGALGSRVLTGGKGGASKSAKRLSTHKTGPAGAGGS